jgi:membrane-associated phospholipid phosphatase
MGEPTLTAFMHVMSFIGSAGCYLPVLVVLFWCVSPRRAAPAVVVLAMSGALNTMLKLVFNAPRPFWTDQSITAHEARSTFGMPSGHAQGSTVAYGLLGLHLRRTVVWALIVVVVVLVGVSRVYLGVHSLGQVVAGWLIGAGLLAAAYGFAPVVAPWWRRQRLWIQFGLSVAVALAFVGPATLAVEDLDGWRMPDAWVRAIEAAGGAGGPVSTEESTIVSGILCGVLAGLSLLARRGWFDAGGPLWRRALRVPVGMAGVGVIWPAGYFAGDATVTIFVTHTLLGVWMTAGASEVFVRLGLADRAPDSAVREPARLDS